MFDQTKLSNSTTINTPATGIIQKSNPKSFFVRMHQNSKLAEAIFDIHPEYRSMDVVVLQTLLTHESWFLVEMVEEKYL